MLSHRLESNFDANPRIWVWNEVDESIKAFKTKLVLYGLVPILGCVVRMVGIKQRWAAHGSMKRLLHRSCCTAISKGSFLKEKKKGKRIKSCNPGLLGSRCISIVVGRHLIMIDVV